MVSHLRPLSCVFRIPWLGQTLFLVLLLGHSAHGEEMQDVVYLKNGSIVRGDIVGETPNRSITVVTTDGNRFVFDLADVERIAREKSVDRHARRSSPSGVQSWYTLWGLGVANVSYGEDVDEGLDLIQGLPGVDRTSITLDLLGFYLPTSSGQTLLGGIVNGFGDRFDYGGDWFQVNGVTYSFSAIHFPQGRIGSGPFLRGDIGFSRLSFDSSNYRAQDSDWGLGGLAGIGVAFGITEGTSTTLTGSYSFRQIEGETASSWSAVVSGLF